MNLDKIIACRHDNGIAYANEMVTQSFEVLLTEAVDKTDDKEFRAVSELDIFGGKMLEICAFFLFDRFFLFRFFRQFRNLLAQKCGAESMIHGQQTVSAAVYNACFLQNREQVRRIVKRFLTYVDHDIHELFKRDVLSALDFCNARLRNHT